MKMPAPKPEDMLELADSVDVACDNPTRVNILNLVEVAMDYERNRILTQAVLRIEKMRGGMMTPWAVRKADVTKLLTDMLS